MATNASFRMHGWDEAACDEVEGSARLTRVRAGKSYEGVIEGEGVLEMLMVSRSDGGTEFCGMERVTGSVDGRKGSFVFRHDGTFEAGKVRGTWRVVPGSGTGDLQSIGGGVTFESGHADSYPIQFDFHFDN